ncbi:MAG: DinB superfamily protein [Chloroflexi bacterium]|nr:MAG: DinB superfamily protein [Chloroflexota bacterium]
MPPYPQSDVDTLLSKMATERASLLKAAEALSAADADSVPQDAEGEEQWTAKEQLAHLWEMERSYVAWARAAIADDGAAVDGLRGEPVAIPIEDAAAHSVAALTAALRAERDQTNHFIRSLPLPHFERRARTQVFGELTVMQWLRSFYRHDRQHAAQIAGRRSDYVPHFRGGREPNQRQMRIDATRRTKH